MRKISITEALNELKLYDSKIKKSITTTVFCKAAKKTSEKADMVKKGDYSKHTKAAYQSIIDLISNRNALKSAVIKSNALTTVTIKNKTMTVAEAIERKNSIQYEETLLKKMKSQYENALSIVNKENKKVDEKINDLLATLIGNYTSDNIGRESQEALETTYRNKNEYELIDPIALLNKIELLETEIADFKTEIDTRLVVSNSITTIEVDF